PTLNIMTATTCSNDSLPSPASSITNLDIISSPIPEGTLTEEARAQLKSELDLIRRATSESQTAYNTAHASIPSFQQLVLTTHAQVATAKQAVQQARGVGTSVSTTSPNSSRSTSNSCPNSSPASNASSPPSPSSPLGSRASQDGDGAFGAEEHNQLIQRLEQEHIDLGLKLSQALRDKAEAEETKKRLSDYMIRAKARIKEIEQKLSE
ncbi:hypothetical protein BGW38_005056, partial [Lunasporangiospora selenospora]